MTASLTGRPAVRRALFALGAVIGAIVLLALALAGVDGTAAQALKEAGALPDAPIRGVTNFVNALKDNLLWFGGSIAILAIIVVGLLLMTGASRAQEIGLKVGGGFFVIVMAGGLAA